MTSLLAQEYCRSDFGDTLHPIARYRIALKKKA
jgi:hypothetical protein